ERTVLITTSEFMALLYIADTKKTTFRWLPCAKKTCVSPRDTALRSLRELKLFLRKKASFFIEMNRA
ncbi:hypothetical protein, partial [Escherichia coli]|uniref:hypothetical protein n=1 Tax=Escherichia coli TaxID=562 RepID=UPI00112FB19A